MNDDAKRRVPFVAPCKRNRTLAAGKPSVGRLGVAQPTNGRNPGKLPTIIPQQRRFRWSSPECQNPQVRSSLI